MDETYENLKNHLHGLGGAVIAFSGGVDSSLLLAAACEALGGRVLAVTIDSPLHPARELQTARATVAALGVRHRVIEADELSDPAFRANAPDRCYRCKRRRFSHLVELARREGLGPVIEGSNRDDLKDFRPGMRAAEELGVRSPFVELGVGKREIRRMARERGLAVWDKPAAACLASRIPYGESITLERLQRIGATEEKILTLGIRQVRVRDHGKLARIEIDPDDMHRLLEPGIRHEIVTEVKICGYTYVCLDLQGYRSGAMNEELDLPDKPTDRAADEP